MFNIGSGELLVVLLLALMVLGPDKLPETIRKVSGFMGDLRRMSQGFQDEVRQAVDLNELKREFTGNPGPSLPPLPTSPTKDAAIETTGTEAEPLAAASDDAAAPNDDHGGSMGGKLSA